jgi:glycerol-3-phosphate dehydrogenase subunit B
MTHDAVVIGAGLAGLVAALRIAESGGRVLVLGKGAGAIQLAPGTVDVLGYDPERVASPARALPAFLARRRDHPYARLGIDAVAGSLAWFGEHWTEAYRYVGDLEANHLLPTALGVPKPSALVPVTMARGDLRRAEPVCAVGLRPLRDFHSALMAENLARATGVEARALEVPLRLEGGRPDENALGLARRFDDPGFRAAFAGALAGRLRGDERVALPAVLGVADPHGAWEDLQQRLGRPVFEVPTLPPSVPGLRVLRALREALRRAGARLILGSEVADAQRAPDGSVVSVRARTAGRDRRYALRWLVLATGGFGGGGLELDARWRVRETVLGLPVASVPAPGEPRFLPRYLDEHPLARAGLAVDEGLRPLDGRGERAADNVLVVGALLAGAQPWREGSGDGLSLASGWKAGGIVAGRRAPREVAA